jgi:hypothetical protein
MTASIYRQHMGAAYSELAPEIQAFHDLQGHWRLQGEVDVIGAETIWGKMLSFVMRFPASSPQQPFAFHLRTTNGQELWQRQFPTRTMASRMSLGKSFIVESFGPMQCRFVLCAENGTLIMKPQGIRWFGLPLPAMLLPQIAATERGEAGRLHFDVSARWPGRHLTVAYRGWLDIAKAEQLP